MSDGLRLPGRKGCWAGCLGCGGAVLLLAAGVAAAFRWSQAQVAAESLRAVGLAAIPREARDVRTSGVSSFFSAEVRVRFQASPAVIDRYLAASPALKHLTPERFKPRHRLIPLIEKQHLQNPRGGSTSEGDATYLPSRQAPWYTPGITHAGRRYFIAEDARQFYGEVIVDDGASMVYITVSRS